MIDLLILEIENKFVQIDKKLNESLAIIETNTSNVINKVEVTFQTICQLIKQQLNVKRADLLQHLDILFKQSINKKKTVSTGKNFDIFFNNSTVCVTKIASNILGIISFNNEFDIQKKFLYLELFNFFTEIEITNDQIDFFNFRITALSRCKLVVYSKKQHFLKIINQKCEELSSLEINSKLILKQIICFKNKIATLFQNNSTKNYYLIIYDENLNLTSYKSFAYDLSLCVLNSLQVICWKRKEHQCVIFDHDLNELIQIGQIKDINEPFYLCDGVEHDGFLLDVSQTKILFYFSNLKNEHSIKIINRETGILDGVINIPFDNVSKLIKFDSKSNILMKSYPDNILRLYNSTGEFLMSRTINQFTDLDQFYLISSDEIVFYNRGNNKLCYF